MSIKNSFVGTALVLGLSTSQGIALDNQISADIDNIGDSMNTSENLKTSALILETNKSVSEIINNPKNCETDELINLYSAFENACKEDKK